MIRSRATANQNKRDKITSLINSLKPNSIIKTSTIAQSFSNYAGAGNHNVGCLLRERDDIEWVSTGTWRVK